VLMGEELAQRREAIDAAPELSALRDRLGERARPVLERMPLVPAIKALLSSNGGVCPEDGRRLVFDPWSPAVHRCSRCGRQFSGERHDRAWAHYQHLWLAERMAHLATLAATADRSDAADRANQLLQAYRGYLDYPNQDNVLGPSRLFFSTYLESIWIGNYLSAAMLLREAGLLAEESADIVSTVADEAANLIGEYDEGLSNRQTWHNAALASIAVWFEDGDLATRAIESQSGVVAHLLHGFGEDGMWYEGDNYHLFALRGQLLAMGWARQAGVDLLSDPRLAARLAAALRAPTLTALPDFTFPARKDSRFGVSLAQPMYLELWENGLARLGLERNEDLWSWLTRLYQAPAPEAQTFDSYLHEAGEPIPDRLRSRRDLSWWSLLEMAPSLPPGIRAWVPANVLVEGQGLAVLRSANRYAALECGPSGGGHGHPDRLNLVLHAQDEYWLPDYGTGSYVARDLFWYRSTLAHNAPRLDGASQALTDAECQNFAENGSWAWARGSYDDLTRTLVAGPHYLLDVVELAAPDPHRLELPWHLSGAVEVTPPGGWEPAELVDEFVRQAERYRADGRPLMLHVCGSSGAALRVHLLFDGDLIRAVGPGAPGSLEPAAFFLVRAVGSNVRIITVLEPGTATPVVRGVRLSGGDVEVETASGKDRHTATVEGWEIVESAGTTRLGGARRKAPPFEPLIRHDRPLVAHAVALPVATSPALDGSLEGFDLEQPILLDHEDQYRRSEAPYPGPEEFSAAAYLNWDDDALYLALEVVKPAVVARSPSTPPLQLDNEPDEIHCDGIQVYLELEDIVHGYLIVPSTEAGELLARRVSSVSLGSKEVRGRWQQTEAGYAMTMAIAPPGWGPFRPGDQIGFDLIVNQMLPGRQRRAGQLVWSGGGGWVWLRGDRQDPSRFGRLELR
jgi:Heparinase II/III-like protein/Carbohydrate family 9 binding domain-like